MQDRIEEFRIVSLIYFKLIVQLNKIYVPPSEEIVDPAQNNDRELIKDFIVFAA